ncbi:P-loop NTPase [Lederbergia graminis]|uniref:P-loop NTPase n=1 Tax=Lederbergia graminis TaxID=735518 RepID=A0ABW0LFU0_9BACI
MRDQAEKLRMRIQNPEKKVAKTIAVVSGKGGVGKSNISINTAMILQQKGYRVLLFDLDIGMGNINIILGGIATASLSDYLNTDMLIDDIIFTTDEGVSYISAGNGLNNIVEIDGTLLEKLLRGLEKLQMNYDFIIFDMAAGANSAAMEILKSVDDIFVLSTPEPTAMTDAYSMMKYLCLEDAKGTFHLICNRADSEQQGTNTLKRLEKTALVFLQKQVNTLGVLLEDPHVRKAVIDQSPFTRKYPNAVISLKLKKLISLYLNKDHEILPVKKDSFIGKLRRFFLEKGK